MSLQAVKINRIGESKSVHPNEDAAKMQVIALLYLLGEHLDAYKRALRNGNAARAAIASESLISKAVQLWPADYCTLQKMTAFIAEDLGFTLETTVVSPEAQA